MLLSKLLEHIPHSVDGNAAACEISSIATDSRRVQPGVLFVARRGLRTDGHRFVEEAVKRGCSAVVVEAGNDPNVELPPEVCLVRVEDSRRALGQLAACFHDYPGRSMTMVAITGTNGKTTTSWIIENMLITAGKKPGVIGTVNYRYLDREGVSHEKPAVFTTPEPVELQALLREMADQGVTHVVMEASSHALEQGRLNTLSFDVAIFTNLSRDHLDYHQDMHSYFEVKHRLFTRHLKAGGCAVILVESLPAGPGRDARPNRGADLAAALRTDLDPSCRILRCGFSDSCDVRVVDHDTGITGTTCTLESRRLNCRVVSPLAGGYNVLNLLAAAATGVALDLEPDLICSGLSRTENVPGRLERISLPSWKKSSPPCPPRSVFVDYAHTPDALENVLQALRTTGNSRLICIFGCGGDRDPGKRPLMGEISARLADITVITTDNPRSEDPVAIIEAIEAGISDFSFVREPVVDLLTDTGPRRKGYGVIVDRREAIHTVCSLCREEDIVLIAGKGHEKYQIVGEEKFFFDDRLEAENGLLAWTLPHLLRATGGRVAGTSRAVHMPADISTDTRSLKPGDIFVALSGANFDGHDYVGKAARLGAGAVIVSRWPDMDFPVPVIVVDDPLKALGDLAAYRRRLLAPRLKVAAITGSSGKTTVKEMTASIFAARRPDSDPGPARQGRPPRVLKTAGNFNNLIGLPLSLLPVNAAHDTAILEMGMNRPGEIARLTAIADPDLALITNIQDAHLEGLGSIEGVAHAKGELFRESRADTVFVVNLDDGRVRRLAEKYSNSRISFAATEAGRRHQPDVKATRIRNMGVEGMRFTLHLGALKERLSVKVMGEHNVFNCTAAAALAYAAGIGPETIIRGIRNFTPAEKRMRFTELVGGIRVIDDTYNANPASMLAAISAVAAFENDCRKVAVLGDMLELGGASEEAHLRLGRQVAEHGYDLLVTIGTFANVIAHGAASGGMPPEHIHVMAGPDEVVDLIAAMIGDKTLARGDWLLVKGSRGMHMDRIVRALPHSQKNNNNS